MRRWWLWVVAAVAAGVVGVFLLERPPEWTAANREALAEVRLGVEALEKYYMADAKRRFEQALALDPECVAAKVLLLEVLDGPEGKAARATLIEELQRADLAKVTPRERFMTTYVLAAASGRRDEAEALLDTFLADHPKDPVALRLRANRAFAAGRLEEAQQGYERLLAVAPNYVVAYNQLGYTAMARGQFDEAEKMFRKYRFIAPDQANPHDSLGELLLLRGRYEEAEREYNQALAVKGDFCASFAGLVLVGMVSNRLELAEATLERAAAEPSCAGPDLARGRRTVARWRAASARQWDRLVELAAEGPAWEVGSCPWVLTHRAHLMLGQTVEALAVEEKLRGQLASASTGGEVVLGPCVLHLEGARLLLDGKVADAAERFAQADAKLTYRGAHLGVFKLFNAMHLAAALERLGERERATEVRQGVASVNPAFAADLVRALAVAP